MERGTLVFNIWTREVMLVLGRSYQVPPNIRHRYTQAQLRSLMLLASSGICVHHLPEDLRKL